MTTSVRDLQIGEMISISAAWVGPQKSAFLAVPQIAPLHDRIDAAHAMAHRRMRRSRRSMPMPKSSTTDTMT
jgi:hypothetical protein